MEAGATRIVVRLLDMAVVVGLAAVEVVTVLAHPVYVVHPMLAEIMAVVPVGHIAEIKAETLVAAQSA